MVKNILELEEDLDFGIIKEKEEEPEIVVEKSEWDEYVEGLELEELAKPQKKKRGKPKKGSNYVIRFTNEETKEIIENIVRFGKNDIRIYSLILIWLTSFLNNKHFKILRNLSGGSIFVHDFDKNTEEIKTITHDILVALCRTGENKKGFTGLKYKLHWDWRENQIIAFVYTFVKYTLYQCISRIYRQSKASNNLYNERRKPEMIRICKIAAAMSDPSLTAVESIAEIKRHGISDDELYTYRHLFAMGDFDNFCSLTDDLLNKIEGNDAILEQIEDNQESNKKKEIYDIITQVVNSPDIEKKERDFLKSYYQIPTISYNQITNEMYEFTQDLTDFLKYNPEYVLDFCDIENPEKIPKNPWKKLNLTKVDSSCIYKNSHAQVKKYILQEAKKQNVDLSEIT